MATIPTYVAYVEVVDSKKRHSSVELNVSDVDGKAYVAAADDAARAATKVGLLLASVKELMLSGSNIFSEGVYTKMLNGSWTQPAADSEYFNNNKLNVAYLTTIGGIPRRRTFSIPQRDTANYSMETNGENINISTGATTAVEDLIAQIADTLLSIDLTACNVLEITVND